MNRALIKSFWSASLVVCSIAFASNSVAAETDYGIVVLDQTGSMSNYGRWTTGARMAAQWVLDYGVDSGDDDDYFDETGRHFAIFTLTSDNGGSGLHQVFSTPDD